MLFHGFHLADRVGTRKLVKLGSWTYSARGEELKSGICISSDIFELLSKYARKTMKYARKISFKIHPDAR